MTLSLTSFFHNFGIKTVAKNDKMKRAYVLSDEQLAAITAAGVQPATRRPTPTIELTVLFDKKRSTVQSGFYNAVRSEDADRIPEPRMGKELISSWLQPGDEVLIGNIGPRLFALKMSDVPASAAAIALELHKHS